MHTSQDRDDFCDRTTLTTRGVLLVALATFVVGCSESADTSNDVSTPASDEGSSSSNETGTAATTGCQPPEGVVPYYGAGTPEDPFTIDVGYISHFPKPLPWPEDFKPYPGPNEGFHLGNWIPHICASDEFSPTDLGIAPTDFELAPGGTHTAGLASGSLRFASQVGAEESLPFQSWCWQGAGPVYWESLNSPERGTVDLVVVPSTFVDATGCSWEWSIHENQTFSASECLTCSGYHYNCTTGGCSQWERYTCDESETLVADLNACECSACASECPSRCDTSSPTDLTYEQSRACYDCLLELRSGSDCDSELSACYQN